MPVPAIKILESADYAGQVRQVAGMLNAGKVVVLPMETVYGAAALLSKADGIERLKAVRDQGNAKPLNPHLARREQAEKFLPNLDAQTGEVARRAMQKLWPGPVGLQFEVGPDRQRDVCGEFGIATADLFDDGVITLRCPDHPVFHDIAMATGGVLAATAAGSDPAAFAVELDGKVDTIVYAGTPRFNKPSTLVKISGGRYQIVRTGVYDERTIRRLMKITILFVCSGNTCRSPMAEAIARKILSERLKTDAAGVEARGYEVVSAGTMASGGSRATPEAVQAVAPLGADLSRHRSRPLSVELINQADVIYTMTPQHAQVALAMAPGAQGKVQLLNPGHEIDDPIGGDAELYNILAAQFWTLIDERLREKILP